MAQSGSKMEGTENSDGSILLSCVELMSKELLFSITSRLESWENLLAGNSLLLLYSKNISLADVRRILTCSILLTELGQMGDEYGELSQAAILTPTSMRNTQETQTVCGQGDSYS